MPLLSLDPMVLSIAIIVLVAMVLALAIWISLLQAKLTRFMLGKDGASLEATMNLLISEVERIHDAELIAEKHRHILEKKLGQSIRGVGLVRFNPFTESTGKQSFAFALINESGDGAIISTLFARERMSVFAKPIKHFASEFELSKEESQALSDARISIR